MRSPRSLFTWLALLLIAAAAVWIAARDGDEPPALAVDADAPLALPPPGDAGDEPSAATGDGREDPLDRAAFAPGLAGGEEDARAELETADDGLEVHVLRADDGTPLPGARITLIDVVDIPSEELQRLRQGGIDLNALTRGYGRHFEADERGRAFLGVEGRDLLLMGATDRLWGMSEVRARHVGPVELELAEDLDVWARVVDGAGAAVLGLPVVLRMEQSGDVNDIVSATTTAPRGLAHFDHLQGLLASMPADAGTFLALGVPLPEPVQVALDREAPPRAPVELVLPPTGSVSVELVDPTGERVDGDALVALKPTGLAGSGGIDPELREHLVTASAPSRAGVASFPHVGLGLELEVFVRGPAGFGPGQLDAVGPAREGEHVALRVELTESIPVVYARAVDAEGAPFAGTILDAYYGMDHDRGAGASEARVRTDDAGYLRIPFHSPLAGGEAAWIEVELARDRDGDALGGRVEVPALVASGRMDVGDVVLRPLPVLVSGTVVDELGQPVAGARIDLQSYHVVRTDVSQHATWRPETRWLELTDSRGRFEIRGRLEADVLRVGASHPEYLPQGFVDASPGDEGLRLAMRTTGRVSGRVVVDEGVPFDAVRLVATLDDGAERPTERRIVLSADGTFEADRLTTGRHALAAVVEGDPEPALVIPDLFVTAGEATTDERLDPVDLRGRIQRVALEVVDASGAAIEKGHVQRRAPGEVEFGAKTIGLVDGRAELWTAGRAIDVKVHAPGYRTALLDEVSGDVRVVLADGFPVELVLVGEVTSVAPPAELHAFLWGRSPTGVREAAPRATFDAEGVARVVVPLEGTYRASLSLGARGERGESFTMIPQFQGRQFEVRDVAGTQRFEIDLSREALDRGLAGLRER